MFLQTLLCSYIMPQLPLITADTQGRGAGAPCKGHHPLCPCLHPEHRVPGRKKAVGNTGQRPGAGALRMLWLGCLDTLGPVAMGGQAGSWQVAPLGPSSMPGHASPLSAPASSQCTVCLFHLWVFLPALKRSWAGAPQASALCSLALAQTRAQLKSGVHCDVFSESKEGKVNSKMVTDAKVNSFWRRMDQKPYPPSREQNAGCCAPPPVRALPCPQLHPGAILSSGAFHSLLWNLCKNY